MRHRTSDTEALGTSTDPEEEGGWADGLRFRALNPGFALAFPRWIYLSAAFLSCAVCALVPEPRTQRLQNP